MTKTVLQAALDAEMTGTWAIPETSGPPSWRATSANGSSPKTVLTKAPDASEGDAIGLAGLGRSG
jgi:hypothetical protein